MPSVPLIQVEIRCAGPDQNDDRFGTIQMDAFTFYPEVKPSLAAMKGEGDVESTITVYLPVSKHCPSYDTCHVYGL